MAPSRSSRSRPSSVFSLSALSTLLLALASRTTAFDCPDILAGDQKFNFKSLGGPRLLHWENFDEFNGRLDNHTFHIDLCANLGRKNGGCHSGARICDVREDVDPSKENNITVNHIDIAGTFTTINKNLIIDAKFNLLSESGSNADASRKGVKAELHGGRFPIDDKNGMDQMAIIEFVCDPDRTGDEGDETEEPDKSGDDDDNKDKDKEGDNKDKDKDKDKKDDEKQKLRRREEETGKCQDSDASLRFCGYSTEKIGKKDTKTNVLRLEWRTKYACKDTKPEDGGSHWGFFTWFIIILFLATASYLIFGSWLNYNRYGARGWDLLPHGDTIRDIPYILKDWARRVASTLQGSGSRGGYSAVQL